jgi:hypothetical protein
MNWKVGDRAVIHAPGSTGKHAHLHGTFCTIVSLSAQYPGRLTVDADECPLPRDNPWKGWAIEPKNIRPIYDGHELVAWSKCAWRPRELVT